MSRRCLTPNFAQINIWDNGVSIVYSIFAPRKDPMKFLSQVYTKVSGSVGGVTYAHNRGGMYARARSTPVNTVSPERTAVKNILADLASRWRDVLDDTQRTSWNVYATITPLIDRLGEPRPISGIAMYIRCNSVRLQGGLTYVDDGPLLPGLPTFTPPTYTLDIGAQEVDVAFANTDDWATEDDGAMLVYASRPISVGRNFFAGPYRLAGVILGDTGTPPTSPATFALPFPLAASSKIGFKAEIVRVDGKLSSFQSTTLAS